MKRHHHGLKLCRKCGESKPLTCFARHQTAAQGRDSRCKHCRAEYNRARRGARCRFCGGPINGGVKFCKDDCKKRHLVALQAQAQGDIAAEGMLAPARPAVCCGIHLEVAPE